MSTKNLGQVAGLWIGNSAPENTSLIWYDNTPAIRTHKVYDFSVGAWVVLDKNAISAITYSELRNLARNTGLTQGSWYKVTDQGNILALAITTTKVQYVDINNNFVIDDLASNATYVVTSSNLLIDDIQGVWNANDKKLMFSFADTVQDDNTADDYIFGKKRRNNVWSLAKYKLSSLVSSVTGNSITWNKGFFFNFRKNLQDNTNVSGGVVGKDAYDTDKAALQQNIDNVAASNQAILNSAKNYTDGKVAASEIYSKALPSAPTAGTAIDIASGDTLSSIVTKIQRWINQFKTATGIKVGQSFSPSSTRASINNNDTVQSALEKTQKAINDVSTAAGIDVNTSPNFPSIVDPWGGGVDGTQPQYENTDTQISGSDKVLTALSKLNFLVRHIKSFQINKYAITLDKIAKAGVLPTDIFRIDINSSTSLDGCGIGGVIIQGVSNNFFTYDPSHPNNPYRLRSFYDSSFPKILAFSPVTPVVENAEFDYSICSSFVHFTEEGITCQIIIQLSKTKYESLYNAGYRYFKGVINGDVYDYQLSGTNYSVALNRITILNLNLSKETLTQESYQHIVLKLTLDPSADA